MTVPAGPTLGIPLSVFFGFVAFTPDGRIIANQDACSAQIIL